jgi:hypothetical protein
MIGKEVWQDCYQVGDGCGVSESAAEVAQQVGHGQADADHIENQPLKVEPEITKIGECDIGWTKLDETKWNHFFVNFAETIWNEIERIKLLSKQLF